ncbi:MAG: electron transfer flavoprotein subunit beta/FixA family protein [Clostridia bacterium]|nr:electron transfer flavoprotein subunit beta/FixA family protein [Clostridia bacterium]
MDIIVCVKQVPGTANVEVDPVTGVLKRDGHAGKLNPYDLFALEAAFRIRELSPEPEKVRIRTLSMGPGQAEASLLETVYMGADSAYLVSDRKFAGSDVQATSYTLSRAVMKTGPFDLIICGKQTTDGDTAQVGPELAEQLGIEHAANVTEAEPEEDGIRVTVNMDDVIMIQKMRYPCLITIDKDANTPRLPSYRRKLACGSGAVTVWTASDLDIDLKRCGLEGSPTRVEKIFPPESRCDREISEGSGDELAGELCSWLRERKFL